MQKTIYQCDQCKGEIGAQTHLTLNVAGNGNTSGIAMPPKTNLESMGRWTVKGFERNWLHLHLGCISAYFKDFRERAEGKKKVVAPSKKK